MLETANKGAIRFRDLTQTELMDRARIDFDKMMGILEPLSKEEWEGFIVEHYYMGPVPAFFYAAGQLMDYAVHGWDILEGRGAHHVLDADSADLLVPFMLLVWKYTIRPDADLTPYEIGLRISGNSGGDYRVSMSEAGMEYDLGDIEGLTRDRVRRREPGPGRVQPHARRRGARRPGTGEPVPQLVLRDLTRGGAWAQRSSRSSSPSG